MSGRTARQRGQIFDQLAVSYRFVDPLANGRIPCPVCLRMWDRAQAVAGLLTLEHVPPESVGGRTRLLTCRACNSDAGAFLDSAWTAVQRVSDIAAGRPASARAVLDVDGVTQRVTVHSAGGGMLVQGIPAAGHPDVPGEMAAALESATTTARPFSFNFRFEDRFAPRLAQLSALRAAYLLTLERLGWRYALMEVFDELRHQFEKPGERLLVPPVITNPSASMHQPSILVVAEPTDLRSVVVSFGSSHVFLPVPGEQGSFFHSMPGVLAQTFRGQTVDMSGVQVTELAPAQLLDHHPEAEVQLLGRPPA